MQDEEFGMNAKATMRVVLTHRGEMKHMVRVKTDFFICSPAWQWTVSPRPLFLLCPRENTTGPQSAMHHFAWSGLAWDYPPRQRSMPRQPFARRTAATQPHLARHVGYPSLVVSIASSDELTAPSAHAEETNPVGVGNTSREHRAFHHESIIMEKQLWAGGSGWTDTT